MKVLFLDIDGVLNSQAWMLSGNWHDSKLSQLDPGTVARLNTILDATDCNVVLSSTWRLNVPLTKLTHLLESRGLSGAHRERFIGSTIQSHLARCDGGGRGTEIDAWLKRCPAESFAILDDDSDMAPHQAQFVQTSWAVGLQDTDVERVIRLLGRVA